MKEEENKRMLALSYIVADLKAENIELAQRVHQLEDDYNDVVSQLNGKETHKDEDSAKLLLDNMQKMRDHCDKLEKENRELKCFAKAIHSFVKDKHSIWQMGRTARTIKMVLMYTPHSVWNVNHAWALLKVLVLFALTN